MGISLLPIIALKQTGTVLYISNSSIQNNSTNRYNNYYNSGFTSIYQLIVQNCPQSAISASAPLAVTNCELKNNQVSSDFSLSLSLSLLLPIWLSGAKNEKQKFTFVQNKQFGIYSSNSYLSVTSSSIYSNTIGVYAIGNQYDIDGNQIHSNTDYNIFVSG